MYDVEVVWTQGFPLSHLSTIEFLSGGEVDKVFVVCVDGDWECGSFNVVSPLLTGGNNCHKLLVMYLVIEFCCCKLPREESHRVESSLIILLVDACSKGIVRGVCFDINGFRGVEYHKYWCRGEFLL